MKTIYIDISMVMVGTNYTGIPRVVMELIPRLDLSRFAPVLLEYTQKRDCYEIIDTERFVKFCKSKKGNRAKMRTGRFLAFEEIGKGVEESCIFEVDAVWKTRIRRSFLYPIIKKQNVEIIPFIHDIIGVTHPQFCPQDDVLNFLDFVGAFVSYADKLVMTSHATKQYVCGMYDRLNKELPPIFIAPLGGNFHTKKEMDQAVSENIKKIAEKGSYLLMVGTIDPRKNHKLLVDAYDKGLKETEMNLVIAGFPGWNVTDLIERIKRHPDYDRGLYLVSGATDAEIDYLYEHCFALAFPSYIEGYGLPIMEALVRGVPVFAADTSINMEIAGDMGVFFEQDNPEDLVEKVRLYVNDKEKYRKQKEKIRSFQVPDWDHFAEYVAEAIKD